MNTLVILSILLVTLYLGYIVYIDPDTDKRSFPYTTEWVNGVLSRGTFYGYLWEDNLHTIYHDIIENNGANSLPPNWNIVSY